MSIAGKVSLVTLVSLVSGCATMHVATESDPSAPFKTYKTFGWYSAVQGKTGIPRIDNPYLDASIRFEIDRRLNAKGYREAPRGISDLLVAYRVSFQPKIVQSPIKLGDKYVPASGSGSWSNRSLGKPGMYVRRYDEATLVVDFVDARTSRLVWRGTAKTEVDASSSRRAKDAKIRAAVKGVLRGFPRR